MRVQAVRWKIARRHLNQRRSHRLRWSLVIVLVLLMLISGASGAGAYYFVAHLPSASKFHIAYAFQNARVFDSRGGMLANLADLGAIDGGRRVVEPLQGRYDTGSACAQGINRIPLLLQNATIATEDATFYKNPGFDALSILRAAYQNLRYGRIVSGASTITQQVVRANHLVTDQRSLSRKAQEVALAYQIGQRFSKRQILDFYLNSVPYGNQTFGAQAAAQAYFHKQVCALDVAQAAFLAGLPRAPTLYDPVRHRSAAITRLHEVLTLMRRHGYLHSRSEIDSALYEARSWTFSPPGSGMRYPQFVRYVLSQLQGMPRVRAQLYHGIDIYTTLDPRLQDLAQRLVSQQINGLTDKHVTDGALVSLDLRAPHYGWILAMVGSANYHGASGQINMAITPRQPGSSMKPFNYIWAFQHGVGPGTTVLDAPLALPDPNNTDQHGWYLPLNYDRLFHGPVTLRQALANSLNVPAVKLEYYITGANHVAATAAAYGMTSLYSDNPGLDCRVCYSVTLGGLARGTRLLQETSAYGVFGTGGQTVPPVAIWKVVQRGTGRVLFCSADCPSGARPAPWLAQSRKQVLDPAHAYEMTNVLADNNARCTPQVCEFGLTSPLLLDHPAAAKTGTTNAFTDNWTLGYTPQIVTGVWAGNADRTSMVNVIGVTGAAPIWHDFMEGAFQVLHLPSVPFTVPSSVEQTPTCRQSRSPLAYTTVGTNDLFIQGDQLPLCRLPEHGEVPISCQHYPQPLPLNWECIQPPGYSIATGYGQGQTPQYFFYNPGTYPPGTYPPGSGYQQGNTYPPGNGYPTTGNGYPPIGTYPNTGVAPGVNATQTPP